MRSNMTIYEGAFVNEETDFANANIQQIISVRLFDTETVVGNGFNALYVVSNNGDGTQTVVFTYTPGTVGSFGYNNGSWVDTVLNESGRDVFNIPEGDYTYSILVDAVRTELGDGDIIDLEMGGEDVKPLLFSVIDNDEDKFTPIKSKQVEIQIHSSNTVDISKFAQGGDNRFYVEIDTQTEGIIFKGFLSISDLRQEFLPHPNIITLTATDGLGFLKDEPLVNFEGETPLGRHNILSFLTWALAKTGLSLDIKACMNIRENFSVPLVSDASDDGHFYNYIYIDAKTFEKEISVCEDCFAVLDKILAENSFLTQYKGKWIVLRIDEFEASHQYYFTRWNHKGEWQENTEEVFTKDIGIDYSLSFMNDDAEVSLERPYKSVIEQFNYQYPEELICNIDFSRGVTEITPPDFLLANSTGTYEVECWAVRRISGSITSTIFIEKNFEYGYEKSRYLVITPKTGTATPYDFAQGQPIEISQGDRIDFSVDWRFRNSFTTSSSTYLPSVIWIQADNGDRYYWYNSSTPFDINTFHWEFRSAGSGEANFYMPSNNAAGFDFAQWTTISDSLDAAPISGKLYVGLINLHQGIDAADDQDTFFSNLQLDITPLINGSYQRYTGHQNIVTQDNPKIKAVRETVVSIGDAPRIGMKGSLSKQGAGNVIYTGDAAFGSLGQFEMSGNHIAEFSVGAIVTISGSVSNNITATITDINYSIIGDLTTIYTDGTTITESTVAIVVTEATYVLPELFYNAAKLTGGASEPTELSPYGQIQAFDVWNQYNRVMVKFEATIDKTDSTTELPDLLHKYIVRDISNLTTSGGDQYKIFQLLHFEMDLHMCEWGCFLHEVLDTVIGKNYETHSFKYLENE